MMTVRLAQGLVSGVLFAGVLAVGGSRRPVVHAGLGVLRARSSWPAPARRLVFGPWFLLTRLDGQGLR